MRRVTLFVNGTSKNGKVSEHTQFSLPNSSKCWGDSDVLLMHETFPLLHLTLFSKDTENYEIARHSKHLKYHSTPDDMGKAT